MKPIAALPAIAWSMLASGSALAAPLDVKLGSWETTMATAMSGTMMPEAQLETLPPAQRERFLAAMKKRQEEGPKARTTRTCLTNEHLERAFTQRDDDKHCKYTMVVATARRQEGTIECTGENARKIEVIVEALSREKVKGHMNLVSAQGNVTMDFTSRWVAAACGKGD